jgi:hypothetical protein
LSRPGRNDSPALLCPERLDRIEGSCATRWGNTGDNADYDCYTLCKQGKIQRCVDRQGGNKQAKERSAPTPDNQASQAANRREQDGLAKKEAKNLAPARADCT